MNALLVQGGRARTQFTTWVSSEIVNSYVTQVDLGKAHGPAIHRRFRFCVNSIHENTHPLLTGTVRIDSTSGFSSGLDFDALSAGLDGITGIDPLDDEIRMPVEVLIFSEGS